MALVLPTQDQVNAAVRHVASFAGGMIVMFGLGTKINPDTLTAIINATGTLVNDAVTLIGLVSPIVMALYAGKSASQTSQIAAVKAMPGVERILVNDQATPKLAAIAVDPAEKKVAPVPEVAPVVAEIAKGA